jgi:hypothetical protein
MVYLQINESPQNISVIWELFFLTSVEVCNNFESVNILLLFF